MKLGQLLGLLGIAIALYILWQIRQILLLVFTAVVLATAINQFVERLQRSRLSRPHAVFLAMAVFIGLLVLVIGLIVPLFLEQFQQLILLLPTSVGQLEQTIRQIENHITGADFPNVPDFSQLLQQIQPIAQQILRRSVDLFSTSINAIVQILLVLVLIPMLLSSPRPYRNGFIRLFPSFYRQRVDFILERCQASLENWSTGALLEMGFVAILSGLGLLFLQVPFVLAHALLAGLLNFIPNIGPTLSVVLPMAVALLDTPWKAIAVLALYIVIQQIESYWLTPTVMAQQVALLPAVTLTSQVIFAGLFGALGLLMALPLTVVAKVWLEESLFVDILDKWQTRSP